MAVNTPETFAERLRREIDRQNLGVRTLARRMTDRPERVDVLRRQLSKYLRGDHQPSVETRHAIEEALGLEHDALADEEDEETDGRPHRILVPVRVELDYERLRIDYDLLAAAIERRQRAAVAEGRRAA
jgi:transcriptional regulator with XRE-family HTH domain